jgi:hypothetical protein
MRHLARLIFIGFTFLRFGLDELALSGFRQGWVRASTRRGASACAWPSSGSGPSS